jgi:aryl-alcohol dehydrogenase-like predicted oxidoreductase
VRRRRLGTSDLELSVVGFGAWEAGGGSEWGNVPPQELIVEAIRTIFETGVDWIDTAETYGRGRSEELVALAVSDRREEVTIATKVAPRPEGSGFRPEDVRLACTESLRRLRTGHLDLYQLHWPDETGVPVEETWAAMAALVDEGLVRAIGVSNFDRALIERCEVVRHVDSLQQEFSFLRTEDAELIRWCGEHGTGVVSYGPLAYGLLAGAITAGTTFHETDWRGRAGEDDTLFGPSALSRNLQIVERLRPVAERLGVTLGQLAIGWNLAQPGITAAIVGTRDPDHARANALAGDLILDGATLSELDAIRSEGPAT